MVRISAALMSISLAALGVAAGYAQPGDGPEDPAGRRGPPPREQGRGFVPHVLPPFAQEQLNLTDEQQKQIGDLEEEVRGKLDKILTPEQQRQLREMRPPRPPEGQGPGAQGRRPPPDREDRAGRPPRGDSPPGFEGRGRRPLGPPPEFDDNPPPPRRGGRGGREGFGRESSNREPPGPGGPGRGGPPPGGPGRAGRGGGGPGGDCPDDGEGERVRPPRSRGGFDGPPPREGGSRE